MNNLERSKMAIPVKVIDIPVRTKVDNRYEISHRLGGGSFGEVYLGRTLTEQVAIKFERDGIKNPQLRHEYKVYRHLGSSNHGFCRAIYYGRHGNFTVLVMDLLGPSLESLFTQCGRRFSLKTVLQLADQMLERIHTLHSKDLIHRDIKPDNFAIGYGRDSDVVHCLDLGMATLYRHKGDGSHFNHATGCKFHGTVRYSSVNNHMGLRTSRRDDLESIGYVLIYFIKGKLPWQGLGIDDEVQKRRHIMEMKRRMPLGEMCANLPLEFHKYMYYVKMLRFDEDPNISYLRQLFRDLFFKEGFGTADDKTPRWDWDNIGVPVTNTANNNNKNNLNYFMSPMENTVNISGNQTNGHPVNHQQQYHQQYPPTSALTGSVKDKKPSLLQATYVPPGINDHNKQDLQQVLTDMMNQKRLEDYNAALVRARAKVYLKKADDVPVVQPVVQPMARAASGTTTTTATGSTDSKHLMARLAGDAQIKEFLRKRAVALENARLQLEARLYSPAAARPTLVDSAALANWGAPSPAGESTAAQSLFTRAPINPLIPDAARMTQVDHQQQNLHHQHQQQHMRCDVNNPVQETPNVGSKRVRHVHQQQSQSPGMQTRKMSQRGNQAQHEESRGNNAHSVEPVNKRPRSMK